MAKKKKGGGLLSAVQMITYVVVGIFLGVFIGMEMSDTDQSSFLGIYFKLFAVVFVSIYIQIITHELGHLIFGLLSGYKFSSFRIAVFTLIKSENGKMRLRLMRVPGTAGQCLLEPPEPKEGRIPQVLYNLGGVIMNLILSTVLLCLKLVFGISGLFGLLLLAISLLGYSFALTNGIPMRSRLISNDGMNAISIRKDPNANRAFYNTLKLAWYQSNGCRMKDMPAELFRFPDSEGLKNPIIASEAVFVIDRAMDSGLFEDVAEMIEITLRDGEGINGLYERLLKSYKLYVSLMLGRPIDYIESLLDKDMRKLLKTLPFAMFGVYTAYAHEKLYLGNLEKANGIRSRFEKKSSSYPYRGEIETAIELMNRVDAQWNIWHGIGVTENY